MLPFFLPVDRDSLVREDRLVDLVVEILGINFRDLATVSHYRATTYRKEGTPSWSIEAGERLAFVTPRRMAHVRLRGRL
jgi:hypothetical protein